MPKSPRSLKSNDGFIVIVALGIMAVMIVVAIMLQQNTMNTYNNIRMWDNYYTAKATGESIVEYGLWRLSKQDVGYNIEKVTCLYGKFADAEGGGNPEICQDFDHFGVADADERQKDIKIELEIKGRALDGENLETERCGTNPDLIAAGAWDNNDSCYVVPFPGTGDVGKKCNRYEPVFDGAGSATVDQDLITGGNPENNGFNDVDQVDYSCNWNKLSFGSSTTDRVAIPLYYDDGMGNIINPFNGGGATTFALRLRTPCKPCGEPSVEGGPQPQGTRECASGQDPTVCSDADRFVLDDGSDGDGEDDIVVQWQLMGTCDDATGDPQECGMVAESDELGSAIYESRINEAAGNIVISNETIGLLTHIHPQIEGRLVTPNNAVNPPIEGQLPIYTQAILNIFLNEALISENGLSIPYLEYQVLTDKPIANPKNKVDVTVIVDGNGFLKTLFRENKQSIIDFAIQN